MAANGDANASCWMMPGGKKYNGTREPESNDEMNCTMSCTPKISMVQNVIVAMMRSKKKLTTKPSSTATRKANAAPKVAGASRWTMNNDKPSAGMICIEAKRVWPTVSART